MHMKLKHTQNFVGHGVPRPKSTPNPTPNVAFPHPLRPRTEHGSQQTA